jgi:hypothetical protein
MPETRCEAGKNAAAGKYAFCRQNAEKGLVRTGDATKYTGALAKCDQKYAATWQKLEQAAIDAGGNCPTMDDATPMQTFITANANTVAKMLTGGPPVQCPQGLLLKTGQTKCYDVNGTQIQCAGTGQDGELRRGMWRGYYNNFNGNLTNPDGTISEFSTGLMWEKLGNNHDIHDVNNTYTWHDAFSIHVAQLNTAPCFAGYCDWRLPNVTELRRIVDYGEIDPAVNQAAFNTCAPGCSPQVTPVCSCTASDFYWSSTSYVGDWGISEWVVDFSSGDWRDCESVSTGCSPHHVRAVRGSP